MIERFIIRDSDRLSLCVVLGVLCFGWCIGRLSACYERTEVARALTGCSQFRDSWYGRRCIALLAGEQPREP